MRTLLLATFLAGIPTAFAQDPASSPSKTQVLELLSGYEESASPESLKALGTSVPSVLQSIASDGSLTHTQRARAVHALGWFPSEDTKSFLYSIVTTF